MTFIFSDKYVQYILNVQIYIGYSGFWEGIVAHIPLSVEGILIILMATRRARRPERRLEAWAGYPRYFQNPRWDGQRESRWRFPTRKRESTAYFFIATSNSNEQAHSWDWLFFFSYLMPIKGKHYAIQIDTNSKGLSSTYFFYHILFERIRGSADPLVDLAKSLRESADYQRYYRTQIPTRINVNKSSKYSLFPSWKYIYIYRFEFLGGNVRLDPPMPERDFENPEGNPTGPTAGAEDGVGAWSAQQRPERRPKGPTGCLRDLQNPWQAERKNNKSLKISFDQGCSKPANLFCKPANFF